MKIDPGICQACESCIAFCPVDAIHLLPEGVYVVDSDECVECGACLRSAACPSGALFQDELSWPRSLRQLFSNPTSQHATTRVPGRGMEEMKTNDVTGRYRHGQVGIVIEAGRPGVGARFRDVEIITRALAGMGLLVEPGCPLIHLMSDLTTGTLLSDVLEEKVLSVIISYVIPENRLPEVLNRLDAVQKELSTVFSLGVIHKTGGACSLAALHDFRARMSSHGKTNLGLGKPLVGGVK